jgi:hypothetical protein
VTKDGKATLDLSKDEKLPLPATVEPLREAMLRVMPHARLADVLIEVDDWVGFQSHCSFTMMIQGVGAQLPPFRG